MNEFFSNDNPVISAKAPGRMDVMGGISDYSGSLLLQMPIRQTTEVSVQRRSDDLLAIRSVESKRKVAHFSMPLSGIAGKTYAELSHFIHQQKGGEWAAYVAGCVAVLHHEKKIPLTGLNISIESAVPVGKGVSSSAALEVAVCCALVKLYGLDMGETELPLLAQKAENLVVGAPCGLMDQLSSYLGHKNKLLPLVCQPHTVLPAINIPVGITIGAIDSGIRHAVSGASYSDVRAAAFMAFTIIAQKCGASGEDLRQARDTHQWHHLPYGGFLANIPASVFDKEYYDLLPEQITGQDFIDQFGISIDTVTHILPEKLYRIRVCAQHPVRENFRVHSFMNLLNNFSRQKDKVEAMELLGELMFQSHSSYSSVGLGNQHTDEIVQRVRDAGPSQGVFGARITGGGSGGTVCVLGFGKDGQSSIERIFREYREAHGIKSFLFKGSSEGARFLNQ